MASRLLALVTEVRRSLGSVASTREQARHTRSAAKELEHAVHDYQHPSGEACDPRLREEMLELAAALHRLVPDLAAALRLPAQSAVSTEDAIRQAGCVMHAPDQLAGCSIAVGACTVLGQALNLPGHDRFRMAVAAEVVLQAGPAYFAAAWPLLQLTGTMADSLQPSDASRRAVDHEMQCAVQLCAVANTIASLQGLPDIEAAFASSTARPAVLLPWLRHVTQALLALPADQEVSQGYCKGLLCYSRIIRHLTASAVWSRHAEQLAADAALCAAVVDALLTRSLPTMPAFAAQDPSLEMVSQCLLATMEALGSASLRAVLRGRLQQGSGAAASKAVVSLAQALPTQRPADAQLREFMAAWMAALQLMVWCMLTACEQPAGVGQGSGGSRSSDSSSGGSRQARGGGSSGAAGSSGDARASAWECVPVAALPRLMQALQCLMDESIGPPGHPQGAAAGCAVLATKCTQLSTAVQQMHRLFASPASEDAYVAVLEAAAAGLQMQPLLVWLHAQLMQQLAPLPEGPDVRQAAALLSHALLSQLVLSPFGSIHWPEVASYGGSAAILAAERRLHTSAARFVHWLAGGGHLPWAAAPGLSAELSLELQQALQHIFQLAVTHHREALGQDCAEVRALCASHLEAAQAAIAACADGRTIMVAKAAAAWSGACLAPAAAAVPGLATLTLFSSTHAALEPLARDDSAAGHLIAALAGVVAATLASVSLAVPFACSGLLELALNCIARPSRQAATEQVALLLAGCPLFLQQLVSACTQTAEAAAVRAIPASLAQQAAATAATLQEVSVAVQLPALASLSPPELTRQVQRVLPAVRQAAAVVWQSWELPQQVQAARLERARAAAGRSCAYLRCANVAFAGGPDAGLGTGSKCCSVCKTAWYCSTACQHADWRDGHKQACPVFAQERQQRREARRGQQAAQQAERE